MHGLWILLSVTTAPQSDAPTITLTKPSCATCRIERRVVVEFGKDPAAQEAAPDGLMGAIAVGDVFLGIVQAMKAVPVVFGPDGKVIKVLGRSGQGPGEFAGPGLVSPWRGDSILIADAAQGRISVFDRAWRFGRTLPFQSESWVAVSNGNLIAGEAYERGTGDFFKVFDASGKRLGSFGRVTAADSVAGAMSGATFIATDGRVLWSVPFLGTYRISEWDATAKRRLRIFVRKGADFPEKQAIAELSPSTPPSPGIRGVYRDGPILWVFYAVADRRWAQGLKQLEVESHTGKMKVWRAEQRDLVYDTIVEAIETATGTLLASQKFDEAFLAFVSTGTLALHKAETPEGEPLSRLVRFELKR